jgi:hypothetical protein
MAWSTGFASVRLRLPVHGDTLRGTARSGYDVGEGREASAMAVRVSCSVPVPSDQRRRHASPLSVPLLTGEGRLQVGASAEPCPDVSARAVGGWCPVEGEAAGPYAGADSLAVYVERGRGIRAIRLTYLDARTLPAVLEGMRAAFGPEDAGSARVRPGGPAWIDRERWIAVREDPAAGAFVVLVADPKWAW